MVTTVTNNSPQSINTSLFSLDRDIQEIKKVTDKLKDVGLDSNVISVNGKRGIVELNASDVGALPDTTVIPTKTSELTNDSGFVIMEDIADTYIPKSGGTFTGIVTGIEFHANSFFPKDNIDSQVSFYPNADGDTKLIVSGYKSLELDSSEGDIFLKSEKEENALNKVVAKSYKVCKNHDLIDPNIPTFLSNSELTNEHKKILRKIFGALCIGKCLSINLEVDYNKPAGTKFNTLFRPLTIIGGQDWDFNDVTINKDGVTFDEIVDISNNYSYLGGLDDSGNFYSVDAYQLVTDIIKNDFSNVTSIKCFATIMENWV